MIAPETLKKPWTEKNCSMGIFSVVIWNTFWLNPKKQRDVNKQNSSSHLNTGTYKLGENNWKSWLFLGQADVVEPRTHNLPLWHWVFIRPNFCSMISSLCWWRWTSVVTQHSNEFGQLAPIASLPPSPSLLESHKEQPRSSWGLQLIFLLCRWQLLSENMYVTRRNV